MPTPFCSQGSTDCTIFSYHAEHAIDLRLSMHGVLVFLSIVVVLTFSANPLFPVGIDDIDAMGSLLALARSLDPRTFLILPSWSR